MKFMITLLLVAIAIIGIQCYCSDLIDELSKFKKDKED